MNSSFQSGLPHQSKNTGSFQVDISSLDTQEMVASRKTFGHNHAGEGYRRERYRLQPEKSRPKKLLLFALIFLLIAVIGSGLAIGGYQTYSMYHSDLSLAQMGIKHLQAALSLMQGLSKNPLDGTSVTQAQQEFAASYAAFEQINTDLQSVPRVATSVPVYGARLSAALHLAPLAVEVSRAGMLGCNALSLIIARLHNPLSSSSGLTMADLAVIDRDVQQLESVVTQATGQVNALQASDLEFDPRVGKAVADFHKYLPTLQASMSDLNKLLPVLPALLGVGTPANYLVELLDSTELRPGGGFIGNYGFATLSGGRLSSAHIMDVYLLDTPFLASGQTIPYPPAYRWFDLYPGSWGFRDSNLDADFPTAARYAEQNYSREGGKVQVQGVIAITPALIEQFLAITGPISVPEYHQTVTAQNLVDLIHYYEIGPGRQGGNIASPDGHSSVDKRFTELLAEHFLARIHQLPSSTLPKLFQEMLNGLHTKDLQVYFNATAAEQLLSLFHVDASIQAPASDSLFIVDANIGADKANQFINSTLHDQVTIDEEGNVVHHTTLTYSWEHNGPLYSPSVYHDYVRIYVPSASTLQVQQGWQARGTGTAFGREVWAGTFTLSYSQIRTITLTWTEAGVAKKDTAGWHYQYLVQRQAGARWNINVQVMLPSCVTKMNPSGGLESRGKQVATFTQSLSQDTALGIDYRC